MGTIGLIGAYPRFLRHAFFVAGDSLAVFVLVFPFISPGNIALLCLLCARFKGVPLRRVDHFMERET